MFHDEFIDKLAGLLKTLEPGLSVQITDDADEEGVGGMAFCSPGESRSENARASESSVTL